MIEVNKLEEETCLSFENRVMEVLELLGWPNDGTAEPQDIKRAFAYGAQWQSQQPKYPVDGIKKYSYSNSVYGGIAIIYMIGTEDESYIALVDNTEKADFICKSLNLCSNNPELLY